MPKKLKKDVVDLTKIGFTAAAGSLALGGIGGTAAINAQKGLSGATSLLGPTGTLIGTGGLVRAAKKLKKTRRGRR